MRMSPRRRKEDHSSENIVNLCHITTVPQSLSFLSGQPNYMIQRGIAEFVISSPGDELTIFGTSADIPTYSVIMERLITPIADIKAIASLARILIKKKPKIVHAHTPKGGLLGMIAAWFTRVPIRIYHIRGLPYMTAQGRRRTLLTITERISCRLANEVFCVSHSLREVAISDRLCSAGKIKVFLGGSGNGVDAIGRFNPRRMSSAVRVTKRQEVGLECDSVAIGFVGRLVRDKGIHELAYAWKELSPEYAKTHLFLIGPLEPQDPISAASLKVFENDPRVHLIGSVNDTSAWYSLLDLVVLPTHREGFPNVPLEAAAMELPVIATLIPGCIDAVQDGVTGTLVPPREVAPLADAMRVYVENSELRRNHGAAGRQRVLRDFRQDEIWEAIYQEYCRLLTERGLFIPSLETVSPR